MLRVRIVLTSLDTHCVGPVSDGAGGSVLGSVGHGGDGGDSTGSGVGFCRDMIGDIGDGVHAVGGLAEGVCFFFFSEWKLEEARCWS